MPQAKRRPWLALAGAAAGVSTVVAPATAHAAPAADPQAQTDRYAVNLGQTGEIGVAATCTGTREVKVLGGNARVYLPATTNGGSVLCTLEQGNYNNDAVYKLQGALNRCYGETLSVDGDFGPLTKAAVQRAQQDEGRPATGNYSWSSLGGHMLWPSYWYGSNELATCARF